jgi:hypothetical protein
MDHLSSVPKANVVESVLARYQKARINQEFEYVVLDAENSVKVGIDLSSIRSVVPIMLDIAPEDGLLYVGVPKKYT